MMAQNPYVVRIVVLQTGERLPMLCSRASGIPLHEPTLYALTELRARNRSTSTIQQALRSVMVLYLAFDGLKIDLGQRFQDGRLLDLGEIEQIVRLCREPIDDMVVDGSEGGAASHPKVASLEKARMRSTAAMTQAGVNSKTAAIRVRYIRAYLEWVTSSQLLRWGPKHELYAGLKTALELVLRALDERAAGASHRNTLDERMGLVPEALARLLEVIGPISRDNPWKGPYSRERNALIIKWLLSTGIRRGELAGVRVSDVNFQMNELLIARRADDSADPRTYQPCTKTNDRLIPLDEDLIELTRRYLGTRRAIKGARRHEYLFVAQGTGAPLSLSAINKIFDSLRRKCPDLPDDLCPHVTRHTYSDIFCEVMDKKQVSGETGSKMLSRVMGWSETSKMAATYTRRHVKRKADAAMLDLQKKLMKKDEHDEK